MDTQAETSSLIMNLYYYSYHISFQMICNMYELQSHPSQDKLKVVLQQIKLSIVKHPWLMITKQFMSIFQLKHGSNCVCLITNYSM